MCYGFNPVSDRISTIRLQCKPVNMTVLQVYAPTSTAEEGYMEEFYEKVQHVVDEITRGDVLYVIGDWNAKVGQDETNGTTGIFGLGERNERGDQLVEFCSRNGFQILTTFFKLHARRLYTWRSPDQTTRNQIDYIICKTRWRSSVRRVTTLPGADCGTDHNLLIADVKIKLRRINRAKQTLSYDVENIGLEFPVEVKNRFNGLQLADREPEELWNDIRDIVKERADKRVQKFKRKKVTKWLSDESVKIADERREVRNKGDDKEYRRLNAAFQRRARHDKEQGITEKCRQIEESNKMGRTRDLYREIKEMTGSYSSRCGAMKLSTGKVVTEGKEVKEIWQQYTEELYRRDPNATDSFNENIYEDEPGVLEIAVKEALRHISNRKSAGCDGIPIELLKAGGDEAVKVMTGLCNCIWKRKEWPIDWNKSVYVLIYKKGDKKECGNYRTIALISHASKVLLRVIQRRLEVFLITELPVEQAGFRRGRGTRDHIANLRWMMEKAREHQRDLYMCFIDYKNAFDCVDHERLWVLLRVMGVPVHLIVLLKRLYTNQEATVRTEFGETENIDIEKGVRQGCVLSPLLFNIYPENIMREALEEWESGISIGGRMVTNLRYADDTTLLAGTKEDLIELVERVRRASEKAGLYLNVGKTKVMTTGDIGEVTVDGKDIEVVTKFVFLGALITKEGLCEKVRRRIDMGKAAMGGLTSIWKDRGVTMKTKVKLVKVLVFPIVLYGAETLTMRKHERRKMTLSSCGVGEEY